jgi:predicted ATPase
VAQVGAAIGRDFSYELAVAVAQLAAPEVQDALRRLVDSGLVFQRGVPPAAEYLFKHALVQEAAYGTLLRRTRQQLHARIAATLQERFPDRVGASSRRSLAIFPKRCSRIVRGSIGSKREDGPRSGLPIRKRSVT